MNGFGLLFAIILAALMLGLPRNWASLPLLMSAAYITRFQQLELGPAHLPVMRIIIAVGLLRVGLKNEHASGGKNPLDRMMLLWSIWNVCSLAFHAPGEWVFRLGVLYDTVGPYFLFRVFIRKPEDVRAVFKMVCILLIPVAATMLVEKLKGNNPLSLIGFGPPVVPTTNGHYRAQGPFGHPILAGTVGAVCLPMAVCFWRENRMLALTGMAATLAIVFASGSSGPIVATLAVLGALALWKIRSKMRTIRWLVISIIVALNFIMNDPVYFLVARIDITGGSTGFFRAKLIQSAIEHLSEWWFAGTDHTRHWMASGISANPNHTDMTNFFIQMGVWGGLPLMLLFAAVLWVAFSRIGKALRANRNAGARELFLIWILGSILFGHVMTFLSISYFDQTIIFLSLALACIGSLRVRNPALIRTFEEPQTQQKSAERITGAQVFVS